MTESETERATVPPALTGPSTEAAGKEAGPAHDPETAAKSTTSVANADGDESHRLQTLEADVRDQEDLERNIGVQVSSLTVLLTITGMSDFAVLRRPINSSSNKPTNEIRNA